MGRRGSSEDDTTLTGYAGSPGENAGHGSEKSQTHIVVQTGLVRLSAQLTKGDPAPCDRDFRVDDEPKNIAPDPALASSGCAADPLPASGSGGGAGGAVCRDTLAPARVRVRVASRGGRVTLSGRAADRGCGRIARVKVSIARRVGKRCHFVYARGRFKKSPRGCSRRSYITVGGTTAWKIKLPKLRRGGYLVRAVAFDAGGRRSRPGPAAKFRAR